MTFFNQKDQDGGATESELANAHTQANFNKPSAANLSVQTHTHSEILEKQPVNIKLKDALLPEIKESHRNHELRGQPIADLMKMNRRANDYLPQQRIMRRKRSNLFKKTRDKDTLNIDPIAEHIKIPFASFVDHKMIKEKRLNGIINKTIDSQIIAVQKQYEIKKNAVID